jgi:hypothetical protein
VLIARFLRYGFAELVVAYFLPVKKKSSWQATEIRTPARFPKL